jgi:multimeric flavodoxin WrbA
MKILVVMGSPHGMKGNTGRLLDEVLAGVQQGGGEVELVSLSESRVQQRWPRLVGQVGGGNKVDCRL